MDIVSKESVDMLLEVVCGSVVLGIFSFTLFGSYIVPIIQRVC